MLSLRLQNLDKWWFHPIFQSTQILKGKTEFRAPQRRQFWAPRTPARVSLVDDLQEHSAGALCHRKKLWLLSADTCGLRNRKLNTPYDASILNSEVNPLLNHAAHDW